MSVQIKLTKNQLDTKLNFIDNYIASINNADSTIDPNSNIFTKNICSLQGEINKDVTSQIKHEIICRELDKLQDRGVFDFYLKNCKDSSVRLSDEYRRQIEEMEIYLHDASVIAPYCMSISLYPLITQGLRPLGGVGSVPQHLGSFIGQLVNLIFLASSQVAGAVACPETLIYVDYFARKDYGADYLKTNTDDIKRELRNFLYQINTPAGNRNYQSVFFNLSYYDKYYFDTMFGNLVFPDGSKSDYSTVKELQKFFLELVLEERRKEVLTFPVTNITVLTKDGVPQDTEFVDMACEQLAKGGSFFVYMSNSVDSLASCCRLRNFVNKKEFSYSMGGSGVQTGSINVISLNFNRLVQNIKANKLDLFSNPISLENEITKIHMYQLAYREYIIKLLDAHLLPLYDAGYIALDKQYLTVGLNGVVEGAAFLGFKPTNNEEYLKWISGRFDTIYKLNQSVNENYFYLVLDDSEKFLVHSSMNLKLESGEVVNAKDLVSGQILSTGKKITSINKRIKVNCELVPAEGLGVKFLKKDKKDGYVIPEGRECYNSYIYEVESDECNPIDKLQMYGVVAQSLDGGSALHLNLEDHLTKEGYKNLLNAMAKSGCNYLGTNVAYTKCDDCGYISINTLDHCEKCGSKNIDWITRVIGYLTPVKAWSSERQLEFKKRHFHSKDFSLK